MHIYWKPYNLKDALHHINEAFKEEIISTQRFGNGYNFGFCIFHSKLNENEGIL